MMPGAFLHCCQIKTRYQQLSVAGSEYEVFAIRIILRTAQKPRRSMRRLFDFRGEVVCQTIRDKADMELGQR